MPGSVPTVRYHQVNSAGNGSLSQANLGGAMGLGGPATTLLDVTHPLDFGAAEAGMWSTPQVLLLEFDYNTASNLDLRVYDTGDLRMDPVDTQLGENFFNNYSSDSTSGSSWLFHATLLATYVDPQSFSTNPTDSGINAWNELAWNNRPLRLDSVQPSPGNDGNNSLLVRHVDGQITRYLTNCFIYIAAKPRGASMAGVHVGWGFRLSYIYPNV